MGGASEPETLQMPRLVTHNDFSGRISSCSRIVIDRLCVPECVFISPRTRVRHAIQAVLAAIHRL